MEISDHELRAAMRQIDEEHRSGMAAMPSQIAEMHEGEGARGLRDERAQILSGKRRGGLALVIGGVVLTFRQLLTPSVANAAAAGDVAALAAFAQSVELAAVEAYKAAAGSGKVKTKAVLDAATLFLGHHTEHAAAFGGAAKAAATNKPNPKLLAAVGGQLTAAADEKAIIKIAYDLENAAAATYLFALGATTDKGAIGLMSSILPVEAQHAVVLGSVLALPPTTTIPGFETETAAVKPADFPI